MELPTTKNRIICFGNRLHGDDAFGCHVFEQLLALDLPADTSLHNGGTAGLSALLFFEHCERALVVDAMVASVGVPVGTLRWYAAEEVVETESELSTHAQGLGYLLRVLPLASADGAAPLVSVLTVAVDIECVSAFSERLSAPVARAVPLAVAAVRSALSGVSAGHLPQLRAE